MNITNVLASVAVANLEKAREWYVQLFERAPDAEPMDSLAEWEFERGGWLQVFEDAERAGSSSVTLVVSNIDEVLAALGRKGIPVKQQMSGEKVSLVIVDDADGNQVVFARAKPSESPASREYRSTTS